MPVVLPKISPPSFSGAELHVSHFQAQDYNVAERDSYAYLKSIICTGNTWRN